MMLLPIVQRELRVASRKARNYWVRWPMAGIPIALFGFSAWSSSQGWTWNAGAMFQFLAWYGFVYCLVGGVLVTADCLSAEKRQNTAGLLFLTDLHGYDVVLGKVAANSLSCCFGLLAMFPVMAIPLILGGVQFGEFWRVVLSLAATLLWSMSLGVVVSTFGQNAFRNTGGGVLLACLLGFGIPGLSEVLKSYQQWLVLGNWIALLSPFHMLQTAFTTWVRPSGFWLSCGVVFLLIVTGLGLSCWRLPRSWQDVPSTAVRWSIRNLLERWRRWNLASLRLRQRLLERNPFAWVACRERVSSAGVMSLFVLMLGIAFWLSWLIWSASATQTMDDQFVLWLMTSAVLHVFLLAKVSWMASERIGSDRQTGALELLLCTPLTVGSIVRGQWRALGRQLLGPAVIVLLLHGLVLYLATVLILRLSEGIPLFWLSWQYLFAHTPGPRWEESLALLCIIGAAVVLVAHWIALGSVGMWLSLRLRQPRLAPWVALIIVGAPPWVLFAITVIGLIEYERAWSDARWFFVLYKIAMTFQLLHDALLSIWAASRVATEFREAAAGAYEFSADALPWQARLKQGLRWAAASAAFVILLSAFHGIENWRGERAWRALQRELAARSEWLDAASHMPPPVPARKNFARAPVVAEGIASLEAAWRGQNPMGISPVGVISLYLTGQPKGFPEQNRNWMRQRPIEFERWQKDYRDRGLIPTNTGPRTASSDVLLGLSRFSDVLREVRDASARPLCRYGGSGEPAWNGNRPYLPWLNDVSEVLRFRAAASLAEGNAWDALDDLRLCLYLADSLKGDPFPESHATRNQILMGVVQVIWEGFASGCWSEEQACWIQGRLSEIQRLPDLPHAVRAATFDQMEYWSQRRSERLVKGGLWKLTRLFSPIGWTYANQAGLYRWLQANLALIADPDAGRIYLEPARRASRELSNSGMVSRFANDRVESIVTEFARAQTALNLAVIACALERFHWNCGAYPPNLESLVPEYIERVPLDVVNGQPLRYRLSNGKGFCLYSLGLDVHDDGGLSRLEQDWVWCYPGPASGPDLDAD